MIIGQNVSDDGNRSFSVIPCPLEFSTAILQYVGGVSQILVNKFYGSEKLALLLLSLLLLLLNMFFLLFNVHFSINQVAFFSDIETSHQPHEKWRR